MTDLKKQISLTADGSGVEAGVGKAKRSLADLGATAVSEGKKAADGISSISKGGDGAAAKVDAATRNMIGSIQRTTAALDAGGRSSSKYFEVLASQRGISADALKPYLDQLDAVTAKQKLAEQALSATAPQLQKVGVSAAQTAAAMRGVPAQFTDIVTSLQGGQAPLTVFLQQGGQLKDMFGGLGPAAQALGTYIAGLITPFTIAAAGIGALAVAMYQGSQESQAYAKALILSGNYLGLTTDQLKGYAAQIASTTGTQGQAAEVLAKLADSGKVAAGSLAEVGAAVVTMNRVLGTSIDEGTAQFAKLSDEPAKASAKLNETLHYLTQSTYDRIRALEEQGLKEEAAGLAQSTYAASTTSRLSAVEANAGVLARAWRALATDAKKAWDEMQGLGRQQTAGEALAAAQQRLATREARGPVNDQAAGAYSKGLAKDRAEVAALSLRVIRETDNAYAEGERSRAEAAKIAASDRLKTLSDEVRTNADKRKKAIDDLNRDYKTLGKATSGAEYDKQVANINDKFKDPKGASPKAFQDDAATKFLETLRQTEASLSAQLAGESKLTDAQREQVKFQQLIADLKDKTILTAEQKSLLANKDSISLQLAKNAGLSDQVEFEKKIADLVKKSSDDAKAFRQQIEGIDISIAAANQSRGDQQDRALSAFGLGDRARQEVDAQRSIRNEYQRYQTQLTKQAADKDQLGSQEYKDQVAKIKAALDDSLAAQTAYFDTLKSKQADWKNGATTALANYTDAINNLSDATDKALTGAFKGGEDELLKFVTTGKGSFNSLANSIIADLGRIAIQQTITGPLAKGLLGALGGSLGSSGGGDALGAFIQLNGYAAGGNPPVGVPSIVGEQGPELFVPSVPGTIVPNGALGGTQNFYVTSNNTVGDVATLAAVRQAQASTERRIASMIGRSQRYGGSLG